MAGADGSFPLIQWGHMSGTAVYAQPAPQPSCFPANPPRAKEEGQKALGPSCAQWQETKLIGSEILEKNCSLKPKQVPWSGEGGIRDIRTGA